MCCVIGYFSQWRLFFSEESNNVNSKNPFQSSTTNDLFGNKNPFFNGGWSASPPVPVNPFMVSSFCFVGCGSVYLLSVDTQKGLYRRIAVIIPLYQQIDNNFINFIDSSN